MKALIDKLSKGDPVTSRPEIKIQDENIIINIKTNEKYEGSFLIESAGGVPVRGIVYGTTDRLLIKENQFDDLIFRVEFQFDSSGMLSGEKAEEAFFIVCSSGEYEIPVLVQIEESGQEAMKAGTEGLDGFIKIVSEDILEGFRIFNSDEFSALLEAEDEKWTTIYDGLKKRGLSEWDMEQFLSAMEKKEPVTITLSEYTKDLPEMEDSTKVTVAVYKNTWGYLPIHIESDAPFLEVVHTDFTTESFAGSQYELSYIVNKNKMHGGRNYGRIKISTPYQELEYTVCARIMSRKINNLRSWEEKKNLEKKLLQMYIDFRTKQINKDSWTKLSLEYLARLRLLDDKNEYYPLYQVQMFLAENRNEEAKWILDKYAKRRWAKEKNDILYAYYLYLTTIHRRDPAYTKRVCDEIKRLYMREKCWQYLWILLYLDRVLVTDTHKRMEQIKKQHDYGKGSSILYLEGCILIEKDSSCLQRLDVFEILLFAFGVKRGILSQAIAVKASELSIRHKKFVPLLYHTLEKCYDKYQNPEIAANICRMLIKANKTESKYFKWYEKGVEQELRITRIYEYYIQALKEGSTHILPKPLLMYFSYQVDLDERKKAQLYANVIQNAEEYPEIYGAYRRQIETFMLEQLAKKNINNDLTIIYKTFLPAAELGEREAEALAEILFVNEIRPEDDRVSSVVVFHKELEREQNAVLMEGSAFVKLYTKSYEIIFTDKDGRIFLSGIPFQKTKLLEEQSYLELCKKYECMHTGYLLFTCQNTPLYEDNLEMFLELYRKPEVSKGMKLYIQKEMLLSYQLLPDPEWIQEFLPDLNFGILSRDERNALFEVLMERGMYDRAHFLIREFGMEEVPPKRLAKLCSNLIRESKFEHNQPLLDLAYEVFRQEMYDKVVLEYLCDFYNQDSKSMEAVWETAYSYEVDTRSLEERILVQSLFTGAEISQLDDIFASYYTRTPLWKVKKAYLVQQSYLYFVREMQVDERLFGYLEEEYQREQTLLIPCRLALLKYHAGKPLTNERTEMLSRFMGKFVYQNMKFSCFREYPAEMIEPYFLLEQILIEYHGKPGECVKIHYAIHNKDGFTTYPSETMKNTYEGIFVKSIPLFFGEQVHYTVTMEEDGESRELASGSKENKLLNIESRSKFGYMNEMYRLKEAGQVIELRTMMEQYKQTERIAEQMFQLL